VTVVLRAMEKFGEGEINREKIGELVKINNIKIY